jgi:hypothetical protein
MHLSGPAESHFMTNQIRFGVFHGDRKKQSYTFVKKKPSTLLCKQELDINDVT